MKEYYLSLFPDSGDDGQGRIYLPVEDLQRFGVTEESILERAKNGGPVDEAYRQLMRFEIDRAMDYYKQVLVERRGGKGCLGAPPRLFRGPGSWTQRFGVPDGPRRLERPSAFPLALYPHESSRSLLG